MRYINDRKSNLGQTDQTENSSPPFLNWKKLEECVKRKDRNPAMFEVYKRIGWHHDLISNDTSATNIDDKYEADEKLFNKIKEIISELLVVEPAKRMKLKSARDRLKELDSKDVLQRMNDFLLLKKRFGNVLFFSLLIKLSTTNP